MKAIVYRRYGTPEVLEAQEVPTPHAGEGQVLVRIRAAGVNPYDWHHLTGTPYFMRLMAGPRTPKRPILGVDFAGEVEAVGPGVTRLHVGDEVYGMRMGAFAEYMAVDEDLVETKPANISFEQASAVPLAALSALQALRDKGRVQAGQRVLINGASGGIGTFAVQLARWFGAEVTGVCSGRNAELVWSLGADRVIDYTRSDFVHSGQTYDLIVDVVGNRSIADRRRVLAPSGTLVVLSGPKTGRWLGPLPATVRLAVAARFCGRQRLTGMLTRASRADLALLRELIEAGKVVPVVEKVYPMHEINEAMRHGGQGHAKAKIVVAVK
ncbi:NAD(P)-dependent alcohol dehydrogenase [Allorhizocola rhizosphaerae]|uniref:NAD(P)-dependent alcohol dehydrogenase n=1 Tax=Allorhizocola rhizosphaerae TaxID=1872709 RepID=UPI000E3CC8C2|nr:NAD(P)-dependent alcohol dehydrogenase [Allorhizocola rhizosphaerae]